jgi:alkylation response protein AidB-like acyl-CoA dehydrogenase
VNLDVPQSASDYGREASRAFNAHGAVDLARRALIDPRTRRTEVEPILEALGIDDLLDVGDDNTGIMACGELCRAAGAVALPYPVAARLLRDDEGRPVAMVDDERPRIDHGDLFEAWCAIDMSGGASVATVRGEILRTKLGAFVAEMDTAPTAGNFGHVLAAKALAFSSMTALGIAQQALALTVEHVRSRHQFGRPLASFQSVQFRLAQSSTSLEGLSELGYFTLARLIRSDPAVMVDALGLRMQTITVTRDVMRTAHQMHGAIGFCDEHDLSMLTRCLQPFTRLPVDLPLTTHRLLEAVDKYGFDSTFPVAAAPVSAPSD